MTGYVAQFASVALGANWYTAFQNFLASLDADIAALLGLAATSSTGLSIATGSTGAITLAPSSTLFRVGAPVRIRRDNDPTTFMVGAVTAASAGSVTVNVTGIGGAGGPYTNWIVTVDITAGPPRLGARTLAIAGTVTTADHGGIIDCSGSFALAFDPIATLATGFWTVIANTGTGVVTLDPSGAETLDGKTTRPLMPGEVAIVAVRNAALRSIGGKGFGIRSKAHAAIRSL